MPSPPNLLVSLAAIAVLGIGSQWLAWRLRLPSILLLLVVGIVAGPATGFLDPDASLGALLFPVVSLSVAVILFEGGLTLELRELRQAGRVVLRLLSVGVLVTWALTSLAALGLADVPWRIAILLGAILTVTGPTVVGPLLRHVRPAGLVGPIAKWEGIVVDVIGATLSVLVLEAILVGDPLTSTAGALGGLARTVFTAVVLGLLGTALLLFPLRRHWIPDQLQSPVALAIVLGVFTASHQVQHESGLLAVTLMGFLLANQKMAPVRHIVEFKENLRVLLISSLFIVLAARLDLDDLRRTDAGSLLFVATLLFVVRPASVLLSTWRTELALRERLFLAWLAPRGIVAAAVSSLFALRLSALGVEGAERLDTLTFLVIIATVAVYGLSAAPLARRLGLAEATARGVLLAGASPFARSLAAALEAEGVRAVLVDTNRDHVAAARLAGLAATYGSILSEETAEEIDLGGIGRLLALTPNDQVNALAALHFIELFGRAEVFQLIPAEPEVDGTSADYRGRHLFSDTASFSELERRVRDGASVKCTPLTETFDFDAFRAHHGERALPLLRLAKDGHLEAFTADNPASAEAGDRVISLADPEPAEG